MSETSEKKATILLFGSKFQLFRTKIFQMKWKNNQDMDTYFSLESGKIMLYTKNLIPKI